ncbi:ABC transporter permease, partial [Candidatus Poribacteria bacterium]|nr:ABC transporter permease [Candidatus Poribacteria bacterium]
MAIPLKYNMRHMVRRWRSTALTVFAIALVVAMYVCVQSLATGMSSAFATSGHPLNVMVLRTGSTAETNSTINREQFNNLQYLTGIKTDARGDALVAPECVSVVVREKVDGGESNVIIRGTGAHSPGLRPEFKLTEGRAFKPGLREVIVGASAAHRFKGLDVGSRIKLVKSEWTIVGKFEAGRSAFESEVWGDADELNREFDRTVYSSILLRVGDEAGIETLVSQIKGDRRLASLAPRSETDYYKDQQKSALPLQFLGTLLATVMSIGAVFAAMNTMYAAIANRSWEIATLRVMGFSRRSVLLAFLIESACLALVGGVMGGLLALPMNGMATGTSNMMTF